MLKMEENKQHFQYIMLYYFKKGKNTTEMQKKVWAVYGESDVSDQTYQKWFVKFRAGDFLRTVLHSWVDQLKLIAIKLKH